jgi:hypothetical protein
MGGDKELLAMVVGCGFAVFSDSVVERVLQSLA